MEHHPETIVFEAEITPHRSLSPAGLTRLIAFLCVASLAVTTLFWSLGAWPIAGFNGGEMLIAFAMLRWHVRSGRARELLRLSDNGFRILRYDVQGRSTEKTLPAAWLNVTLQERSGRVPGLFLHAHGRREEVAAALGEDEKRSLAQALSTALHVWRHPVFDNPQLNEFRP